MKKLWQILVPVEDRWGDEFPIDKHQKWDSRVREIAGGLTIFKKAKGQWLSPDGTVFPEAMIPVLVCCTDEQIDKIADYTMGFYSQEAVMYWCVSEKVVVKHVSDIGM